MISHGRARPSRNVACVGRCSTARQGAPDTHEGRRARPDAPRERSARHLSLNNAVRLAPSCIVSVTRWQVPANFGVCQFWMNWPPVNHKECDNCLLLKGSTYKKPDWWE